MTDSPDDRDPPQAPPDADNGSRETAPVDERPTPATRRRWPRLLAVVAVGYLLFLGVMMAFEDSLIFFPSVYPAGDWRPRGLEFEDAWFETADGVKLHGWFVPCEQPRAVVLFAHGNAGNLSDRIEILQILHELNLAVMIFDYRGYGRSSGAPSEAGVLADARAARRWLAERCGISESQLVLLGESLGGGVMVDLAAADGARGLVLLNTFSSLVDVAAFHYRWLPVRMLMRTRLDSVAKIARYHGPLLQIHGDADTIVPLSLAEKVFAAANEPKQLVLVPGGDHNDPPSRAFRIAVDQFITRLAPQESPAQILPAGE